MDFYILYLDAGGQVAKETVRYQSRHDFQRQTFPISIQANRKEFSATLTSGAACLFQDTGSNVSIEVSKGTRAVIKQYVHTNLEALGFATSSNECIVSPVVTVHTREIPSDQDAAPMNEKKETGDDRPIELKALSAIMPRKLKDQPIKFKPSSPKEEHSDENQSMKVETVYPGEAGDTDDGQPMKHEPLSPEETGNTDDDQSMKLEPSSAEEAGNTDEDQSMKLEPSSPEEAGNTNDDQPMRYEPLSTEEGRDPDVGQPIKLEPLSPEEARHTDDDQSKKLEIVCPKGTRDSDGDHSIKSKPLSFEKSGTLSSNRGIFIHYLQKSLLVLISQLNLMPNLLKKLKILMDSLRNQNPYLKMKLKHTPVLCIRLCTIPRRLKKLIFKRGTLSNVTLSNHNILFTRM